MRVWATCACARRVAGMRVGACACVCGPWGGVWGLPGVGLAGCTYAAHVWDVWGRAWCVTGCVSCACLRGRGCARCGCVWCAVLIGAWVRLCGRYRGLVLPRSASSVVFWMSCGRHSDCRLLHAYRWPPSARGVMWSTRTAGRRHLPCSSVHSQMGLVRSLAVRSLAMRASSWGCVVPSQAGRQAQGLPRAAGLPQRAQARGGATGISASAFGVCRR